MAPSHAYSAAKLERGLQIAREHGHDLRVFDGIDARHRYFAGPATHRVEQLLHALTSDEYGAVWVVRGGSGLNQLLRHIDFDALPQRPVIGFSDTTSLLLPLCERTGSQVVHGPVLHSLGSTDDASIAHLFRLMAGEPTEPLVGRELVAGVAEGRLVGGNLTVIASMCGTPWQPQTAGAILVLEDVGEHPYRIDRNLEQLRAAGVLDGLAGVALGEFTGCDGPDNADWTLLDVFQEALAPLGVPVTTNLPIGHGARNHAFPMGARARMSGGALAW